MERPKVTVKPIKREVTGEIVYLDEMRRIDQFPDNYENLPDMAIQMYEETADLYIAQGVRPEIMDTYDRYDATLDDFHASCAALAEELLSLKKPDALTTFVDIAITMPPEQLLERLRSANLGELIAGQDEQLALAAKDQRYGDLDIKKRDARLTGADVTVFGWSKSPRYFMVPRDEGKPLRYPADESMEWYELDMSFSYDHPQSGGFVETIVLSIGSQGALKLSSRVHVSAYAEQGYEGHGYKELAAQTDEDVCKFVDLLAEIVGDEPMSTEQYWDRELNNYIDTVCSPLSAQYLREWLANSWSVQVIGDLKRMRCGEVSLGKALITPNLSGTAHQQLVAYIDTMRASHNERATDTSMIEYFGKMEPWKDSVER